MSSNIFKISAVAATIAASFGAQAALYNVYPYPNDGIDYEEPVPAVGDVYSSAIQSSSDDCWTSTMELDPGIDCTINAVHTSNHKIAYEEQFAPQGFSYREEIPFLYQRGYEYVLEDGFTGFENYCRSFLDYADTICASWAKRQYSEGYALEGAGYNNSNAYVEGAQVQNVYDSVIINGFVSDSNIVKAYGTYYGGSLTNRSVAFNGDTELDLDTGVQNKVFASDGTLLVGSISYVSGSNSNDFYSRGAIWNFDGTLNTTIALGTGSDEGNRDMSGGSLRDIADVSGTDYAVGFNSLSEQLIVASAVDVANPTTVKYVTSYNDNEDNSYLNSKLTSISTSGLAIGEVKYAKSIEGAYANRLFYTDVTNGTNLSPTPFNSKFASMFFSSANGKAGAINNNDEVVGQVDYERHQEANNGKPRAKRAFIAPLSNSGVAPLQNKSWYLDDLIYGGNDGNKYRIFDATDINDAGVIAATAFYCAGGYSTDAINADCSGDITISAVKLVPINGATAADIQTRPVIESTVERQGASLGFLALTLLGFLGFRRK